MATQARSVTHVDIQTRTVAAKTSSCMGVVNQLCSFKCSILFAEAEKRENERKEKERKEKEKRKKFREQALMGGGASALAAYVA